MENKKRNNQIKFRVTEEEKKLIEQKMALIPTQQMGAYRVIYFLCVTLCRVTHFLAEVKAMKLLIAGSRSITDLDILPYIPKDTEYIISGDAKGVDRLRLYYIIKLQIMTENCH